VLDEQPDRTEIMKRLLRGADPKTQTIPPIRDRHATLRERNQRTDEFNVTQAPEQRRLDLALPTGRRVSSPDSVAFRFLLQGVGADLSGPHVALHRVESDVETKAH
jgi:hypothetical protein